MNALIKTYSLTVVLAASLMASAQAANVTDSQVYLDMNKAGHAEMIVNGAMVDAMIYGQLPASQAANEVEGDALPIEKLVNYEGIERADSMKKVNGQIVLVSMKQHDHAVAMLNNPKKTDTY